ncbi:MAG: anthranilate synthase component I [Cytophagia bacterium]|nr:anthranilate synthase component I [Cytophagia bacterium]
MRIKTNYLKFISDTLTPVSIFLKVRDKYSKVFLLESSDYRGNDNSLSYICFDSISDISINNDIVKINYNNEEELYNLSAEKNASYYLNDFSKRFNYKDDQFNFPINGLFGYMSFDSSKYFENINFKRSKEINVPDILYNIFKYVVVINHHNNELFIFEHLYGNDTFSRIDSISDLIKGKPVNPFKFKTYGFEEKSLNDSQFKKLVNKGINHCKVGDVFQIVLSKRFYQKFNGDDFQVYRALRSINPSPYLFYFDYGNFKIFGSSPEAQIKIKDKKASIYPIAGTFKRTGNDKSDKDLANILIDDEKENSEHIMLVDLARNDLSKVSKNVKVDVFKDIQYYSHVIHLVSKVSGDISAEEKIDLITGTFPAGTLSGAPKYKALELIDLYEKKNREFYGGAIGYMGFNGDFNHAIIIRSFLSKNKTLFYQAGAGIVAKSNPENENQEVYNKVEALRKSLIMAEKL